MTASDQAQGNGVASKSAPADDDIISSVLGQIQMDPPKPEPEEVANIFVEPGEPLKPMTRPVPVDSSSLGAFGSQGMDTTIDLALWKNDPNRRPRVIRGFNTDTDRVLVLKSDTDDDPDFVVKRTKDGIPVLCLGAARLLALPGLSGDAPINALLLDVV